MLNIANLSGSPVLFRDDDAEIVEILPGEAKAVKIDRDHPSVVAQVNAGLIQAGGTLAQVQKAGRERSGIPLREPVKAAEATPSE